MRPSKKFVPHPFTYHEEIELQIESLANLGHGIGRINNWVVMVPFVIPGELIRARVYKNHKNYSEADLIGVLTPSPSRIPPTCSLFTQCGGCQYQHINYQTQLTHKTLHIKELFDRNLQGPHSINPTIGSPKEYFYRSKLTPHFPSPEAGEPLPIGFLKYGSTRKYTDVPFCPIATQAINDQLTNARSKVLESRNTFKRGGTLLLRDTLNGVTEDPNELVYEKVNQIKFQFRAGDFFQNNPFILPLLVDYVKNKAQAPHIQYLIDTYCGSGMFGLCLSDTFKKCFGIELNESAVEWAKKNSALNNITNCEFVTGSSEEIFKNINVSGHETTVIMDPPRKGSTEEFLNQLLTFKPSKIIYISCDPATQVRDLKHLLLGGYTIKDIQPFDLFPQTRHIENVVTLEI